MRKPPTSYHIMNTKANHDTNGVNNGLLYVIRFFEGGLGQNVYSMGTIHRRKCTHCHLEMTSTMPRCFLVTSTMSRHIEKNETRNKNRSFHMKRKKKSFIKTRKKNRSSHLGKKSLIPNTSHWKQHRQQAHYTSFSGKIIVCCQRTVRSFRCASPRAWTCLIFADGDYWCVSGQHSVEAVAKIREKRRTACLDLQQWHTTCIAYILKPTTPWACRAKLAGQAQGSAQDVEPIPLYEAADNLI